MNPRPLAVAALRAEALGPATRDAGGDVGSWLDALPQPIRAALATGDTLTAIELLETEVARQPRNPLILGTLGVLLADRATELETDIRERQRAQQLLESALRYDPENPRYVIGLATLLRKRLMAVDARRVLVRAFEAAVRRPGEITASELAQAFYDLGRSLEIRVLEYEDARYNAPSYLVRSPECSGDFCRNWTEPRRFYEEFQRLPDVSHLADSLRTEMVAAYDQALQLEPEHLGAQRGLLAAWARLDRWDRVLAQAERYRLARPEDAWGDVFVAAAHYWRSDVDGADALFRAAIARLTDMDRRVFQNLSTVLSAADELAWSGMTEAQQATLRELHWRSRDPLHLSGVNERELEHLARVALAELLFGEPQTGLRGWETDRGQILIRYGRPGTLWQIAPPGEDLRLFGLDPASATFAGRVIFWNYDPDLPSFIFHKQLGRAAVRHMPSTASYAHYQDMVRTRPDSFDPPFRDVGPLAHQIATFRGSAADPGTHEILIFGQLPTPGLATSSADTIVRGIVLLDPELAPVAAERETRPFGDGRIDYRLLAGAGTYSYAIEAMSLGIRRAATGRGRIDIEPIHSGLSLSDLLLTAAVAVSRNTGPPGSVSDLEFQPLRCLRLPANGVVGVTFEIYGLSAAAGRARYRIALDTGERPTPGLLARLLDRVRGEPTAAEVGLTVEREVEITPGTDRVVDWFEIGVAPGSSTEPILLRITVTDLETGDSSRSERRLGLVTCE